MSQENPKDSIVNQITLDCLINKEIYDKYFRKETAGKSGCNVDLKFYRKRIYDLVKKLLISKTERNSVHSEVNQSFNQFVKVAINYFQTIDKMDILQKEYEGIECNESLDVEPVLLDENADRMIMRQINMKPTTQVSSSIENFVIRKTKIEEEEEPIKYPHEKQINLKDESLKNKGIAKKKNINNKYEKQNEGNKKKEGIENENENENKNKNKNKKFEVKEKKDDKKEKSSEIK